MELFASLQERCKQDAAFLSGNSDKERLDRFFVLFPMAQIRSKVKDFLAEAKRQEAKNNQKSEQLLASAQALLSQGCLQEGKENLVGALLAQEMKGKVAKEKISRIYSRLSKVNYRLGNVVAGKWCQEQASSFVKKRVPSGGKFSNFCFQSSFSLQITFREKDQVYPGHIGSLYLDTQTRLSAAYHNRWFGV